MPVARTESGLVCPDCGSDFLSSNGVPMLLPKSAYDDSTQIIAGAAGDLDRNSVAVALADAGRYRLKDPSLRPEFSQFSERYADFFAAETQSERSGRVTLVAHYFNPRFAPGEHTYRSLRIRNDTAQTLVTEGDKPFAVSYQILDDGGHPIGEGAMFGVSD